MNEAAPKSVVENIEKLATLRNLVNEINQTTNLITEYGLDDLLSSLSSIEGAKADTCIAFTLATLCFVKLNLAGKDISKHPIHETLTRIKAMVQKINAFEKKGLASSNEETQAAKRMRIDADAAGRMIKSAVDNTK